MLELCPYSNMRRVQMEKRTYQRVVRSGDFLISRFIISCNYCVLLSSLTFTLRSFLWHFFISYLISVIYVYISFVIAVYALWKAPEMLPSFTLKGGEVSRFIIGGADLMFPGISIPPEGLPSFSAGELWTIKVPGNPAPIAVSALSGFPVSPPCISITEDHNVMKIPKI